MKRIIYIASILSILNTGIGWSKEFSAPEQTVLHLAQIKTLANTQDDDRFKNWTEEQYKHYEDSAYAKLYPPVRIEKADSAVIKALSNVEGQAKLQARSVTNTHVLCCKYIAGGRTDCRKVGNVTKRSQDIRNSHKYISGHERLPAQFIVDLQQSARKLCCRSWLVYIWASIHLTGRKVHLL